jgi:hypothetical protein
MINSHDIIIFLLKKWAFPSPSLTFGVRSALLPVSAFGLGLLRPDAACAAGPVSTALQRGLQSGLTQKNHTNPYLTR